MSRYIKRLVEAADEGGLRAVRSLVERGADVNGPDEKRRTALVCASAKGHIDVVRYLIDNGADASVEGACDEIFGMATGTALCGASAKGHSDVGERARRQRCGREPGR